MERLTVPAERLPDGGTRIRVVDARAVREHAMELYWRLKKYEDTGLSPDDVTDLMGSHAIAIGELAKVPKWIPVTERLPVKNADGTADAVLVTNGWVQHMAYFINGDWLFAESGEAKEPMFYAVTHWMPLPKPPKEVSADA